MTDYNTIADARVDEESPITETLKKWLRDNPIAIAEGASGAPRYQTESLDTDSVVTNAIRDSAITTEKIANGSIGLTHFSDSVRGKTVLSGDNHQHNSPGVTGSPVPYTAFTASQIFTSIKLSKHVYVRNQFGLSSGQQFTITNKGFYNFQCPSGNEIYFMIYVDDPAHSATGWFGIPLATYPSRLDFIANTFAFCDGANQALKNNSGTYQVCYYQRDYV